MTVIFCYHCLNVILFAYYCLVFTVVVGEENKPSVQKSTCASGCLHGGSYSENLHCVSVQVRSQPSGGTAPGSGLRSLAVQQKIKERQCSAAQVSGETWRCSSQTRSKRIKEDRNQSGQRKRVTELSWETNRQFETHSHTHKEARRARYWRAT